MAGDGTKLTWPDVMKARMSSPHIFKPTPSLKQRKDGTVIQLWMNPYNGKSEWRELEAPEGGG